MFKEILDFATTASPIATIALLVCIVGVLVFRLIVDKPLLQGLFSTGKKISDVQDEKYPELKKHLEYLEELYGENKKFQENHSMHEIPEIVKTIARIENKIETGFSALQLEQKSQGERIANIEGRFDVIRGK